MTGLTFFIPKSRVILLLILAVTATGLTVWHFTVATPAPSRNSTCEPGNCTTVPCTFDSYIDSGKYVAKNCQTGIGTVYSSPYLLWTGILASNEKLFFEAGTWDMCASGGAGATIKATPALTGIELYGVYNQTVFTCSAAGGGALGVGDQNAVDSVYHAQAIYIHDMTFDGGAPSVTNGFALSITTSFDVYVDHVIVQNAQEMATGGFRITNVNAQQIINQDVWILHSLFLSVKATISGVINGGVFFSTFKGMPPNPTHRALIDFSKGDISPTCANMLSKFDFGNNIVTGWTDTTGGFMAGFQAMNNDTISNNYVESTAGISSVGVATPCLNGVTISGNIFAKATGGLRMDYGNEISIVGNQWLTDSTPASGSTAISIGAASTSGTQIPVDVLIQNNQIRKWGGVGIVANFTQGSISNNVLYNENQANGNGNSNAGILVEKGLTKVTVIGNTIVSDTNSGAGTSRPITYLTAATNDVIISNFLDYHACGDNTQTCGVSFAVSADSTLQVYNNWGFNPYGKLASPFATGSIGLCGVSGTVSASSNYLVCGFPLLITSTGGTGVSITISDQGGNTLVSGLTTLTNTYLGIGDKINFGGFSVAPTVVVAGV